jgi:hypothetical protein
MIRWAVLVGIFAAMLMTIGCGSGMAVSQRDRLERSKRIADVDRRQFTDDWDRFWLEDDVSHLSPWRTRSMP